MASKGEFLSQTLGDNNNNKTPVKLEGRKTQVSRFWIFSIIQIVWKIEKAHHVLKKPVRKLLKPLNSCIITKSPEVHR